MPGIQMLDSNQRLDAIQPVQVVAEVLPNAQ